MAKAIPPELASDSFSCPHCGAISHQTWYRTFARGYQDNGKPFYFTEVPRHVTDASAKKWAERMVAREVFVERHEYGESSRWELINLHLSHCYSCDHWSVWVADQVIYPQSTADALPSDDMPLDVRADFVEAAKIVNLSARGAAALLRLAIQKLMVHIGGGGRNLDSDIGMLVAKGLDERVQKALDVVRVVGNHAVHPGQIDLRDDKSTALRLFELVNVIVAATIGTDKKINELYGRLPKGALEAIERRDTPRLEPPKGN